MRIQLTIEYDGTAYSGWQRQAGPVTVQQTVEEALERLMAQRVILHAAGRTDAGVHALGQVAHFDAQTSIPPEKISFALNSLLPSDIRIRSSKQAEGSFHARFDAIGKHYRYTIFNAPHASALLRNMSMHVPMALNLGEMQKAAEQLAGRHDFAAFTCGPGPMGSTVREIYEITLTRQEPRICIDVRGNGFLYNMVRIIAGTLIDVGKGKIQAAAIPDILASGDRRRAGQTARACGLCMIEVYYA